MPVITDPFTAVANKPIAAGQINSRFGALFSLQAGLIDADNFSPATRAALGLSDSSAKRRGKSVIAAPEVRTNTAYGTMPTPDLVPAVVLPTDGLIFVLYQARWQESVLNAARAAIFLGGNQIVHAERVGATPTPQETLLGAGGSVNIWKPLATLPMGLFGTGGDNTPYTGDVTTGQIVGVEDASGGGGGILVLKAAAGTYDVSVQFKASSGSVTVTDRSLWVWTEGF